MSLRTLAASLNKLYAYLIIVFLILYLWKMSGIFWVDGISNHLSNFALTGIGSLLLITPAAFGRRRSMPWVMAVVSIFIVANVVVEEFTFGTLNGFNVVDGYDAVFGVVAALIVLGTFLFITRGVARQNSR